MHLHGHDNGLGTTGHGSSSAVRVIVHPKTHCDDLSFHLSDCQENIRVQGIGHYVSIECGYEDLL